MSRILSSASVCLSVLALSSAGWTQGVAAQPPNGGVRASAGGATKSVGAAGTAQTGGQAAGSLGTSGQAQGAQAQGGQAQGGQAPGGQAQGGQAPGGQATSAPTADTAIAGESLPRIDARGKTGISPYTLQLLKGNAAHIARDYRTAVVTYKDAIASNPDAPFGYYLLGETQLTMGNIDEAEASFAMGLSKAEGSDNAQAKLLFVLADLRARQGKFDEAKKLWSEYTQFVAARPQSGGHPASAVERVRRIEQHAELAKRGEAVRQRIEERIKAQSAPPAGPANRR